MRIENIEKKEQWESFLEGCQAKTFLQSWNWGEVSCAMGEKIWRFGFYNGNELIAVALTIKKIARRGTFLLVPHGPVTQISNFQFPISNQFSNLKSQILQTLLERLKKLAEEEGASFVRMNPLWERSEENARIFQSIGFRNAPMHANAYEATWKLDLDGSEEELLKRMRKTTRYLIRQTLQNKDIEVIRSDRSEDVQVFNELNREVGKRQQFVPFSPEFVKNEFEVFSRDASALWVWGRYKGEIASGALLIFWSGIGFYHQAGSRAQYAKLSIPYLVQWEAIKEAKKRGCALYDFWGYVDPEKYPNHPWAGPTLFKMGFGGRAYEYVKTQDFPFSWKYWPIAMFELLRKKRRHL